uniref:Fibronectin type-III domain-containing protein n=1 Tax=Anolis carolinensis TaxID=28377 RepID=G1KYT2_ANOCA|nr:PREDICTED: thrombopoietin receptor [Anolis carolinensis]|eukprot:XP_008107676.1 PREDICTED: thrombopoietin receptor [Anolis carolinensis]
MAVLLCWMRLLPLLVLLTCFPELNFVLITDEEVALLAEAAQNISCFSRTFEDLTCFWDEPANMKRTYHFFYAHESDQKKECTLTSVELDDGGLRHSCNFSCDHDGIQLFRELNIEVIEAMSNHTTRTQKLFVETVGLIDPPTNVTAEWLGVVQQLRVMWNPPPTVDEGFLSYEVLYHVEGLENRPTRVEVTNINTCYLQDLFHGQQYHIRVRTKPDGVSLDGYWGRWSPEVLAEIPYLSGSTILNIGVLLLFCTGLLLGVVCIGLPIYSTVKQKIWPPIPDLHHVLNGFLEDNGKQQQVNSLFCHKTLEDTPLTCMLEVLSERPVETQSDGPLLESISGETEWDSPDSSCQHYMVLRPQGSHHENEYFDGTGDGPDTLPLSLDQDPHIISELKIQLSPFTLLSTHLGSPGIKEEQSWEASEDQSASATHISNQSYLLMA